MALESGSMHHKHDFGDVLASSCRAAWLIEDVLPAGAELDFSRRFLPDKLARVETIAFLADGEKRVLNQIRGHEYLSLFGLVEEFVLPFVVDHARPDRAGDGGRGLALLNFASEEAKHIELFRAFRRRFAAGFGTSCAVIGPAPAIASVVLRHDPLAVALIVLMVEWMTQTHYLESVQDDGDLDGLFRSLLRHHWIEEAQHARLDALIVEGLAADRDAAGIRKAVDEFLEIVLFLDAGLKTQARYNLDAFEQAAGRSLAAAERSELHVQQHQALRWTYLGSGLVHPRFLATLAAISPEARERIVAVAPAFS